MALKIFNRTGLLIEPSSQFDSHLLYDYLNTTTYKWLFNNDENQVVNWLLNEDILEDYECEINQENDFYLIEDFEFSVEELLELLTKELESQGINTTMKFNTHF